MNMDNHIRSIGTIFETRMKDDMAAVKDEVAKGRTVHCGKDSYIEFGKWFSRYVWLMPDFIEEIARKLATNPNLRHGKITRPYWGNGKVFTWHITEHTSFGTTLHLDFHGEAHRGLFERLSWWWLARAA